MKSKRNRAFTYIALLSIAIILFLLYKNYNKNSGVGEMDSNTDTQTDSEVIEESNAFSFLQLETENNILTEEGESYKISATYPKTNIEEIDTQIEDLVLKDIKYFKDQNKELFNPVSKNIYEFKSELYKTDKYLSFVFNIYEYTGGAHGNIRIKTLNFNKNKELLDIGSLFIPGTSYLKEISTASRDDLKERFKDYDPSWIDEGTEPINQNFEDFYFTEENTLNIIFEPYTVGPWVIGTPTVGIDLNSGVFKNIINK